MRTILLTLLAVVIVAGALAAAGFTGYRFGYMQGVQETADGPTPGLRPFDDGAPRGMREFGWDHGFHRGFGRGVFPMMGFGFFPLLRFLIQIVLLGLIAWFAYWLLARSGWRLTRTTQTAEAQPQPSSPEAKESNNDPQD